MLPRPQEKHSSRVNLTGLCAVGATIIGGRRSRRAGAPRSHDRDHDDGDRSENANGDRRAFADVVNLANTRAGFESGAGDRLGKRGKVGLRRRGRTVRIAVAYGGKLPGFYGHANTGEIADVYDAVKHDYGHDVVFVG